MGVCSGAAQAMRTAGYEHPQLGVKRTVAAEGGEWPPDAPSGLIQATTGIVAMVRTLDEVADQGDPRATANAWFANI